MSSKNYFTEFNIKIILLQAMLVQFLIIKLFARVLGNDACFYNINNYKLESLIMLVICKDKIKETYI